MWLFPDDLGLTLLGLNSMRIQEALRKGVLLILNMARKVVMVDKEVRWFGYCFNPCRYMPHSICILFWVHKCMLDLFFVGTSRSSPPFIQKKKEIQQRSSDEEYDKYFEGMFLWYQDLSHCWVYRHGNILIIEQYSVEIAILAIPRVYRVKRHIELYGLWQKWTLELDFFHVFQHDVVYLTS